MSESPENADPALGADAADEPAALMPDEPTAVHATPDPAAGHGRRAAPARPGLDAAGRRRLAAAGASSAGGASSSPASSAAAAVSDRPEIAVGAAFAGGLVLAAILKRLAR